MTSTMDTREMQRRAFLSQLGGLVAAASLA